MREICSGRQAGSLQKKTNMRSRFMQMTRLRPGNMMYEQISYINDLPEVPLF